MSLDWATRRAVIIGMDAYAIEVMRSALEHEQGVRQVVLLTRQVATVMPRILDWMNLIRPVDQNSWYADHLGSAALQDMVRDLRNTLKISSSNMHLTQELTTTRAS